jgi:VanZ family protein
MPGASSQPSLNRFLKPAFGLGLACVTYLSLAPGSPFPSPGHLDKVKHATAYALLAAVGMLAYRRRHRSVAAFLLGWGILMEFSQRLVPHRTFDWLDIVANCTGLLLAWVGVSCLCNRRKFPVQNES